MKNLLYKSYIKRFCIYVLMSHVIFFSFLWISDPLHIFHKPWVDNSFSKNMRLQAAGIINNYEFDSVVLGTSLFENFKSDNLNKALGGNFINISMAGSDFFERNIVLEYLLKRKKIKNLLFSFDNVYMNQRKGTNLYPTDTYDFLYDDNYLNDFKVYLNDIYIKSIFTFNSYSNSIRINDSKELDNIVYWYDHDIERFGGYQKWFKYRRDAQLKGHMESLIKAYTDINNQNIQILDQEKLYQKIKLSRQYIDQYVIQVAKKYPDTNFSIIFPPIFIAWHSISAQTNSESFYIYKDAIKYMYETSKNYNNIHIYSFDDKWWIKDISKSRLQIPPS